MNSESVLEGFVEECHNDHVGLWEIVKAARRDLGSATPAQTRALTLSLVRRLLECGMLVGHPAPDGRHFVSWGVPAQVALSRIEQEWSALERDPDIGEVAWFTSAD